MGFAGDEMKWNKNYSTPSQRSSSPIWQSPLLPRLLHLAISLFGLSLIGLVLLISSATATNDHWNDLRYGSPPLSEKSPLIDMVEQETGPGKVNRIAEVDCALIPCEDAVKHVLSLDGINNNGVLDC